ncbi:hypothetical protein OAB57_04015 [Bacteriovoracaceae bacterium]|nr:hypothetical protein [Bacteriovoracaceae bacterium]
MNKYLFVILGLPLFFVSCSDGISTAPSNTDTVGNAFPSGLAFASPTAVTTAADGRISTKATTDSYSTKAAALATMIAAASDSACDFSPVFTINSTNAGCYGPSVTYTSHPADSSSGSLPSGDVGMWDATDTTTTLPCGAAQLNTRIEGVANLVDSGVFAMASFICIAKRNSHELPSAGETLDLTTSVQVNYTTNTVGLTVSSATIARDTDTSAGLPVYITTLVATGSSSDTLTVRLKHIPASTTDNDTYDGKLSIKVAYDTGLVPTSGNCTSGSETGYTDALSVSYNKASTSSITYDLRSGTFCGNTADPYISTTNLTVDATKTFNATTAPTGWGDNFNFARFNMDPVTGAGKFRFAWQAGSIDSATRVMNAYLNQDTDATTLSGCTYFGFGPALTTSNTTYTGIIDRIICNWVGPGGAISAGDYTGAAYAQRQCISNTSGTFAATSSNLSYAITNDCTNSDSSFRFYKMGDTSPVAAQIIATTDSDFLVAVTEVANVGTITAPTDVDL